MLGNSSGLAAVVFWLSLAGWMAAETFIFVQGRSVSAEGSDQDRGSVWPLLAAVYGSVALALAVAIPLHALRLPGAAVWFWLGIVVLWAGIGFRMWAVRTLGSFFQPVVTIQTEHRLVTSGPYRLVRHPSYTGALLTTLGVGLATANPVCVVLVVVIPVLGYLPRIAVEEQALAGALGAEYAEYQRVSARLVPGVW
ncbi:methyltransferase family protein [Nocardia stercoris]|uniref:Isoprenylcysteine carboxylmethyltransferase family protein n=1 Tax=Nocardia stercoris TaxID=2483361 RepID=A0A3M2KUW9_9NOCA|nr:isoprenylcysteine carboxylmethyltransferase family protein [Nocardia stercoris]RMI29437.1 isoprenylcysteine carboxylmethyltransferase family protein [Nocardia stercoris]